MGLVPKYKSRVMLFGKGGACSADPRIDPASCLDSSGGGGLTEPKPAHLASCGVVGCCVFPGLVMVVRLQIA